jgi:quaternary ammonium compound-resistance protein SugE
MHWIYLIVAGLLEVAWAAMLKRTDGFTRLWPTVWTLVLMGMSFYLLGIAMKRLPISTGYAVWVGIGAVGTAFIGMYFLGEDRSAIRIASIALIVLGVIGLRFADPGTP